MHKDINVDLKELIDYGGIDYICDLLDEIQLDYTMLFLRKGDLCGESDKQAEAVWILHELRKAFTLAKRTLPPPEE